MVKASVVITMTVTIIIAIIIITMMAATTNQPPIADGWLLPAVRHAGDWTGAEQ